MINVNDKDFVVPGQLLAEDEFFSGRGTYKDQKKIISSLTGRISIRNKRISVVPLKTKYIPKRGDVVIGEVTDVRFSLWEVDLNSPYSGILPGSEVFGREKKDLNRVFKVGDVLFAKVVDVDEVKKVKLGLKGRGMGKFRGGLLVNISPTKVPRLIGKKGSMINMIKDKTKCKIVVGQNGLVWVRGDKDMEIITKNIIKLIEAEAHISGLTNRIRDQLYLLIDGEIPPEILSEDSQFSENHDDYHTNLSQDHISKNRDNDNLIDSLNGNIDKITITEEEVILDENGLEKPRFQNFKEEVDLEISHENQNINESNLEKEI
ncbi:MAG: exosome complex protein Rrp4 [Methanobrevibacter sp.]|jgi:exosome complex component RRP4|nr:exosome complex protein Rrp4 [Candidatus Methanoflexus mossambicus]